MKGISTICVQVVLTVAMTALTASCGSIISGVTNGIASDLSDVVLESTDIQVVAEALPAYLLLVDALIESNPNDANMLNTAAMLNAAYATAFVSEEPRQKHFASKAKRLALQATCRHQSLFCDLNEINFDSFQSIVASAALRDIDYLYVLASSWASWIQTHADDYAALAELLRAKLLMARVIELDATHGYGSPYIYMGVFATFLPAALGGEPEVGRAYFERAIDISQGTNLYAKTLMAEMYARAIFDRQLHDQLIEEVLTANPVAAGLTLQNVIAQKLAAQLKESADDFF